MRRLHQALAGTVLALPDLGAYIGAVCGCRRCRSAGCPVEQWPAGVRVMVMARWVQPGDRPAGARSSGVLGLTAARRLARRVRPTLVLGLALTVVASSPALAQAAATAAAGAEKPAPAAKASEAADAPWLLAGRQGIVNLVIVPTALARDRSAYQRQIDRMCQPDLACFINFYTNSGGAPVALPLADEIDHQATATLRRSPKRAAESFTWSCRLAMGEATCF